MRELLYASASLVALCLDAVAVLLVAAGAAIAAVAIVRHCIRTLHEAEQGRAIYVAFARWLVGALTFQLGADIVETTIAPGWDEVGHMAAVAAIRTFLTFFLDRDLERAQAQQEAAAARRATKVQ